MQRDRLSSLAPLWNQPCRASLPVQASPPAVVLWPACHRSRSCPSGFPWSWPFHRGKKLSLVAGVESQFRAGAHRQDRPEFRLHFLPSLRRAGAHGAALPLVSRSVWNPAGAGVGHRWPVQVGEPRLGGSQQQEPRWPCAGLGPGRVSGSP